MLAAAFCSTLSRWFATARFAGTAPALRGNCLHDRSSHASDRSASRSHPGAGRVGVIDFACVTYVLDAMNRSFVNSRTLRERPDSLKPLPTLLALTTLAVVGMPGSAYAQTLDAISRVACYLALANDITPLIGRHARDTAAADTACDSQSSTATTTPSERKNGSKSSPRGPSGARGDDSGKPPSRAKRSATKGTRDAGQNRPPVSDTVRPSSESEVPQNNDSLSDGPNQHP